jgi:hypothetical protein
MRVIPSRGVGELVQVDNSRNTLSCTFPVSE